MRLIATVVFLVGIIPGSVLGCTCNIRPPACFSYWETETVFIGTVRNVVGDEWQPESKVQIAVDESFRGALGSHAETYNYGHSCAHSFQEGHRYLFYGAPRRDEPRVFDTSYCLGRTAIYSETLADLEFLRAVRDNKPVYWAWGTISEVGYDSPLKGISAEVLGQPRKIQGTSDVNGDLKLEVPKPGSYRIRIYLPKDRTGINSGLRNDQKLWEMQRKQIVGGRFRGNRPYVDFKVMVGPNRCGWFDVSIPD